MEVIDMRKILSISVLICYAALSIAQGYDCSYPVVLVHGINSSNSTWDPTTTQLAQFYGSEQVLSFELNADYTSSLYTDDVQWVSDPNSVTGGCLFNINFDNSVGNFTQSSSNEAAILKQGYALSLAINRIIQVTGKPKVILVAHSMGGLASRDYLQRWAPTNHKVAKLVTLGTPHQGANIAQNTIGILVNPVSEASRDLAATVKIETSPGTYSIVPGYFL